MKALILAAGYATRLHPLTLETSKSLLPVGRQKMIDWILDKADELGGIDSIYIITNAKFFDKFNEWRPTSRYAGKISLINDGTLSNETRQGAIRDLSMAVEEKRIDDDLLVLAGDNLFDLELRDFMAFAKKNPEGISVALHDINDREAAKKFGVVSIDKEGAVTSFEEKPREPRSTLISTGIYFIPRHMLFSIKEYLGIQGKTYDAPGYYVSWMAQEHKVYGFAFLEGWCDIGDIESYMKASQKYSKKEM